MVRDTLVMLATGGAALPLLAPARVIVLSVSNRPRLSVVVPLPRIIRVLVSCHERGQQRRREWMPKKTYLAIDCCLRHFT